MLVPASAAVGEVVEIEAPHGATRRPYAVTIATKTSGIPTRTVTIVVSEIAVDSRGRDDGPGTASAPFQTLRRALDVAGAGDAIVLTDHYVEGPARPGVLVDRELPARLEIIGSEAGAVISTYLRPAGDLTLANLTLNQPTLAIEGQRSTIVLQNVVMPVWDVRPVAPRIFVTAAARGASVVVADRSRIEGNAGPTISVEADESSLEISNGANVFDGKGGPALSLHGERQKLAIRSASLINWMGAPSMIDMRGGGGSVVMAGTPSLAEKDCVINGTFDVEGRGVVVSIADTTFRSNAGPGGILFKGTSLRVDRSEFEFTGIMQDSHGSRAVIRNTKFTKYREAAYELFQGHLDLGNQREWGGNQFKADSSRPGVDGSSPVALNVIAAPGADAAVTVSGSTFEDLLPPAVTVTGVNYCAGQYRITSEGIPIAFY
jgi:hypothetical protein